MAQRTPRFFYFDLGNVLFKFDHEVACRQMAEVAGVPIEQVWAILFESPLQRAYERGELSTDEFYEAFCQHSGTHPARDDLLYAASDIFELDPAVAAIIAELRDGGARLGILSNTCDAHWRFLAAERFPMLERLFDVTALSFRLHAAKPERAIYEAAARLAGAPPAEIFFVDDRVDNVDGALAAGFDAVQFTSAPDLRAQLARRGAPIRPEPAPSA